MVFLLKFWLGFFIFSYNNNSPWAANLGLFEGSTTSRKLFYCTTFFKSMYKWRIRTLFLIEEKEILPLLFIFEVPCSFSQSLIFLERFKLINQNPDFVYQICKIPRKWIFLQANFGDDLVCFWWVHETFSLSPLSLFFLGFSFFLLMSIFS